MNNRRLERVHIRSREDLSNLTGDPRQLASIERVVKSFGRRVKLLKEILKKKSDCDSVLYIPDHKLLDCLMKDLQRFEIPVVLDSMSYELFNVHIKHTYKRTSQRKFI